MNLKMCDVCLAEGRMRRSHYRSGYKQPHRKIDVCAQHKSWGHDLVGAAAWDEAVFTIEGKALDNLEKTR